MSKVLQAACSGGIVTAEGVPVPLVEILCEGVGDSTGVLILDEDKAYYLAKTSPDLVTTLEKLLDSLQYISNALGALDGAGFLIAATGGVPSAPLIILADTAERGEELDIVKIENGKDLEVVDTVVSKAGNILGTQVGYLEYVPPTFGVDLKYFLQTEFQIQNESFKAYLIERLTQHQVNVSDCLSTFETFVSKFTFRVDDANKNAKGFIL